MRNYAILSPTFWTGPTGRQIRALGREAQIVALYLISCPTSTMIGLYYMPLPTLCHETGCSIKGALKALRSLGEVGFCQFDDKSEHIWIPEMAKWQIGDRLDPKDKRVKAVERAAKSCVNSPYFNAFLARYAEVFHLAEMSENPRGIEAPSMPHRSQEQEQEQEQDQEPITTCPERLSPPASPPAPSHSEKKESANENPRKTQALKKPTTEGIGAVVITLPLRNGTEAAVTDDRVAEWAKTYPAVDVRQQLAEMRQWSIANVLERKTSARIERFITGWLGRAQEKARAYAIGHSNSTRRDRSGAPLPTPRKTDFRDVKDGDRTMRVEYDIETGQELRRVQRKNPKGEKS